MVKAFYFYFTGVKKLCFLPISDHHFFSAVIMHRLSIQIASTGHHFIHREQVFQLSTQQILFEDICMLQALLGLLLRQFVDLPLLSEISLQILLQNATNCLLWNFCSNCHVKLDSRHRSSFWFCWLFVWCANGGCFLEVRLAISPPNLLPSKLYERWIY